MSEAKEHNPIFVVRGAKPTWRFEWNGSFYEYRGRKHRYKICFPKGGYCTKIWIGRICSLQNGQLGCYTVEKEIGATAIDFNSDGLYRWK